MILPFYVDFLPFASSCQGLYSAVPGPCGQGDRRLGVALPGARRVLEP